MLSQHPSFSLTARRRLSPAEKVFGDRPAAKEARAARKPGSCAPAREALFSRDWGLEVRRDLELTTRPLPFPPVGKRPALVMSVLDGAGLDIDFHLASPEGKTLVFEQRKSDGVHTIETEVGDYMFCFDNTFSTISEKVIFFELILDNMGEQEQEQEDWKKYITGTDMLDMKLEDILESINSIKSRLSKSGHIQTLLRAFEARDRNIQESNFDRVNFWSMVNLVVMVVVSAIQVYMLKSLFEDKRKSRT
uniref:Transmembrane p24 trafficking protein 5 n=1 Tax=Ovis aries TaxID=9940 RepID=A0AC11EF59_SHEEP